MEDRSEEISREIKEFLRIFLVAVLITEVSSEFSSLQFSLRCRFLIALCLRNAAIPLRCFKNLITIGNFQVKVGAGGGNT
jgi:hypothetical protein